MRGRACGRIGAALLALAALAACSGRRAEAGASDEGAGATARPTAAPALPGADSSAVGVARTGAPDDALREPHAEHIPAGGAHPWTPVANPYANDAAALKRGAELFQAMNCAGCHGDDGVGSWCPALDDGRWRYGGSPANLYQTIYYGRPLGMPSFRNVLAPADIWRLVAYVGSLSRGKNPATESWVGPGTKAVTRTGG